MSEEKKPIKGINLCIQDTKKDIVDIINKSQLPPGILLMILNEFVAQMQVQNLKAIETESKAFEK